MFFRTIMISLVLGATLLLSWLSDVDLASTSSLVLFAIIGLTYLLTIIYALLLRRAGAAQTMGIYQLAGDLLIAGVLIHVTGGAQSAYTFFFPLAVVGGATLYFRRGAMVMAASSLVILTTIAVLGWSGALPVPEGARVLPTEQSSIAFARSLALNGAAIIALSLLATNLGSQLQRASAQIETQASAAADLLTLHEDIVRSLTSGLITTTPEGTVQSANRAASDILGLAEPEIVGQQIESLFPTLPAHLGADPRSAPPGPIELVRKPNNDNQQILSVSVSPLSDHLDEIVGQVISFQDMTELRQMEEHVKRSERLAVIGELAAGVAHEIRNPLASISGSVELLKGIATSDESDSKALMEIVIREIDRLNSLISELLDYANPRPPQTARLDIADLCEETLRVCRQDPRFEAIDFSIKRDGKRGFIMGDAEKLRQVVWNLLRNASEAVAAEGGKVGIDLHVDDHELVLKVIDNGPGIANETLERIFHPFFTTKASGSGLGLAMVQAIVGQHDGTVVAANRPEGGTEFIITLPLADPA